MDIRVKLLSLLIDILGVRIFEYEGKRENLVEVSNQKLLSISGSSIEFRFYEKLQIDTIVRGNYITKSRMVYYVLEATFSDDFKDTHKNYNNKRYYMDFKYRDMYPTNVLLSILLDRFVSYLSYELSEESLTLK